MKTSWPLTGALTTSQFPVFTLYVQKNCLKITPATDPAESVTDGRGALRININGQRNAQRPGQRPLTSRAEPVGANTVCSRAWSFERVQGYELDTLAKRRRRVASRQACQELCLGEREFTCRSVESLVIELRRYPNKIPKTDRPPPTVRIPAVPAAHLVVVKCFTGSGARSGHNQPGKAV